MGTLQFTSTAISNLAPKAYLNIHKSEVRLPRLHHPQYCYKPFYSIGRRIGRNCVATENSQVKVSISQEDEVENVEVSISQENEMEKEVEDEEEEEEELEPPSVDFAFVSSVLLPDGTPDVHYRMACGGQKLRNIMLDHDIELYGPYNKPLLNCGGGGTCGTCMVEVVDGKEMLNPRTDKEKEILKKKPKNWRLACQTIVGQEDSRGQVIIQILPEWKAHQWNTKKN